MKTTSLTLDSRVERAQAVLQSETENETVMLDIEKGLYYGLNDVASDIYAACGETRSISELCDELLKEYEVEPAQCQTEVLGFVERMIELGLLRLAA